VHLVEEVVQQQIQDILVEDKIMNWIKLEQESQLEQIVALSHRKPQAIFKHSTRCSISVMAKSRLERSEFPEQIQFHYLDLLQYRDISNKIAEQFGVHHQSPQILLIKNGECIFEETHSAISMDEIVEQAM